MTVRVRLALPTLALGLLAPAALGQSVLYKFGGDLASEKLGFSVSDAGDVNADGFPDLIVGSPGEITGTTLGRAEVFSGKDGSILRAFEGDVEAEYFGVSVSGAGDVNGDGFDDVIVGAPFANRPPPPIDVGGSLLQGRAIVFSGKDGSTLHLWFGDSSFEWFGHSVSGAGDVNGDGFDDIIVGAPFDETGSDRTGSARVFSGKDGSRLFIFYGDSDNDLFGFSVSGAGDVNADGFDDLIVGAWRDSKTLFSQGSAWIFSGGDGSVLYTFSGDGAEDSFGQSVSGAGDVNGDGFADVIVGAPGDDNNGNGSGSAWVFSGADGSILNLIDGNSTGDKLGYSVSGAGDVNGDGFDDMIVGAWGDDNNGADSGSARVFSGANGSVLYTLDGDSTDDRFGMSVSGAGDVNGDGIPDLIVGAPHDKKKNRGRAWVFSGCGFDGLGTNYCGPANLNSTGQPAVIEALGSEVVVANCLRLTALQLPTQQFGYFLNSQTQSFVPFAGGSQGNLCLGGAIGRNNDQIQNSGITGEFAIQVDLTMLPTPGGMHSVIAGETWNFQAWFRDNSPGPTSNFTDGVSITFL